MRRVAGVASIPSREIALHNMLHSMLHQVDLIYLALNNYSRIPEFAKNSKIKVFTFNRLNQGDAGKFFRAQEKDCYFFSCDDDIVYPHDYTATCIKNLNKAGPKVICTYGGRTFLKRPVRSYYNSPHRKYSLLGALKSRAEVEFPYSGVASFNTKYVTVRFEDFVIPNMADIWLAMIAKRRLYKCIAFPHPANWFRYQDQLMKGKPNIYDDCQVKGDKVQTKIVNTYRYLSMKG